MLVRRDLRYKYNIFTLSYVKRGNHSINRNS